MKKIILSATFAFALLATSNTFAQQGFGTNQPDKSAAVDIVSSKRGLLIPRVALTSTDSNNLQSGSIANPAHSLFVYNTATAGSGVTAVTPGFYYWERDDASLTGTNWSGKWVRFVSSNIEKNVVVAPGENVQVDPSVSGNTTTYTVGVKGGRDGQVLVTKVNGGVTTTEWTDPNDFVSGVLTTGNAIGIAADPNDATKVQVKFNGTLSENTTIATGAYDFSITGLNTVATAELAGHDILIMDSNGLVKKTTFSSLANAQNLTLGDGLAFEAGITGNDGVGAVLKATKIEIEDKSVKAEKLLAENPTGSTDPLAGKVATADANGNVTYQAITPASLTDKKTLSTDGIIVVGADALTATANTIADAVLTPTYLKIKDESITSTQILNGTIQTVDMQSGGNSKVLVTAADGTVSWIDQSALGNKDAYTGVGAIGIAQDATTLTNTNGGLNYNVSVATASGTTLGVVKEVATAPTVNINASGELSINTTNTVLVGDVTGPLNATKVEKIQRTAVSATAPTTDQNVLVYNGTAWTPTELTGSHITGAALTSSTLNVPVNTALLAPLTIEIKPGAVNEVLTTINTGTAADPVLEAKWATPNSLVQVRNGINTDNADYIELGGDLMRATEINTAVTDATHTLAIKNLVNPTGAETDKIMIVEDNGVLRTIVRSLSADVDADYSISSITGYNSNVQEINLKATIGSSDIDITLPAASSANKGQVVNIGIANTTEPSFYVNIIANGGTLTYGSMPYQGWIVKSNGSVWVIVGRN